MYVTHDNTDEAKPLRAEVLDGILQVKQKLADGTYPTEPVRCPCGADFNDLELTKHDRYGIPHRNVLCRECALIRATPRMTREAYHQFYNTEYRPIYDGWDHGEHNNDSFRFMRQADRGLKLKEFLKYFDINPTSVVDVGANLGGELAAFQEDGCKVAGIEWNEHGRLCGQATGIPMYPTVQAALAAGVKADLVLMEDVIEHLLDFDDLKDVAKLMNPDGVLMVTTPGIFFARDKHMLWQNAHTFTFVGATLSYILGRYGFTEIFVDENISSLWHYTGEPVEAEKPGPWTQYILEELSNAPVRTCPPVRGVNKFDAGLRWRYMDDNLSHGHPDWIELCEQPFAGEAMIVAGGPSADTHTHVIREVQSRGGKVFAIDRMYPWCMTRGITPDFVVALDSCDDVLEGFTHISPTTIHLLNSCVHPAVRQVLADQQVYFVNALNPYMKVQNLWYKHGYERVRVINLGGSVSLGCFAIAMSLGFKHVHFVGMDLKVTDTAYASGIAGKGVPREYFHAEVGGKPIQTCLSFLGFAQQFFRMAEDGRKAGALEKLDIHGDSLINDMWAYSGASLQELYDGQQLCR